jgi:hypothetical protein
MAQALHLEQMDPMVVRLVVTDALGRMSSGELGAAGAIARFFRASEQQGMTVPPELARAWVSAFEERLVALQSTLSRSDRMRFNQEIRSVLASPSSTSSEILRAIYRNLSSSDLEFALPSRLPQVSDDFLVELCNGLRDPLALRRVREVLRRLPPGERVPSPSVVRALEESVRFYGDRSIGSSEAYSLSVSLDSLVRMLGVRSRPIAVGLRRLAESPHMGNYLDPAIGVAGTPYLPAGMAGCERPGLVRRVLDFFTAR